MDLLSDRKTKVIYDMGAYEMIKQLSANELEDGEPEEHQIYVPLESLYAGTEMEVGIWLVIVCRDGDGGRNLGVIVCGEFLIDITSSSEKNPLPKSNIGRHRFQTPNLSGLYFKIQIRFLR